MNESGRIDITLVNYRNYPDTVECIESLRRMTAPDGMRFRIIVVDNASGDDSQKQFHRDYHGFCKDLEEIDATSGGEELLIVFSPVNLGFSGGNNIGIRLGLRQNAEYFWLLNNDTVVPPDALCKLYGQRREHGLLGARLCADRAGSVVSAYGGGILHRLTGINRNLTAPGRLDYISGACCFFSAAAVRELGMWEEKYFLDWEDIDFSRRALDAGYELSVVDELAVFHRESVSIGKRSYNDVYYRTRNCFYYYWRHERRWFGWIMLLHLSKFIRGLFVRGNKFDYERAVCRAYVDIWKML